MYSKIKQYLQILAGSFLMLSCTAQPPKQTPASNKQTPASTTTQAATKPVSKTARALIKIELGDTAKTLNQLSTKLPNIISASQLEYNLRRELKDASAEIDLTQGTELELGFADDILGFVVFSFALKKEHRFSAQMKTTPGLDSKGHQFAVRPLPGSLLSPFNRVLYLDVIDGRLLIMDHPEGMQRLPLKAGLTTPTLRASIDFASLWHVFGLPYQEVYISEKEKRQFQSSNNEPTKPQQDDIFWESLFMLGGSIARLEVQAETTDGVLVSLEVSTKLKIPPGLESLSGDLYEILPTSHFGFRAVLPKSVVRVIAAARRRLAPPAFDSVAMYYPIAENLRGSLSFGGAIDEKDGFWAVGRYPIDDAAMARLSMVKHFSETPKADAIFLEPGRTFQFKTIIEKDKDGGSVDLISSLLKTPTPLEKALKISTTETLYKINSSSATTITATKPQQREALLAQSKAPKTIPAALAALLERQTSSGLMFVGTSQPTSQVSASKPFAFFWLSQAGIVSNPNAAIDTAATISQVGDKLLFKLAFLPSKDSSVAAPKKP
jgi:hypothetical protein